MLGMGWWEITMIIIVIILITPPEQLPTILHKSGRFLGEIRRFWNGIIAGLEEYDTRQSPSQKIQQQENPEAGNSADNHQEDTTHTSKQQPQTHHDKK